MKRLLTVTAALMFSLALLMPLASAKTVGGETVVQDAAKEEADAYGAWYTAYKAQDAAKTLELGKAFVQKFPSSKYADFIKKDFLREYGILFGAAVQAKNVGDIIKIGKEVLADNPDNLDFASAVVVQVRTIELNANPPVYAHAADAADFAERSIKLAEAGKTAGDPGKFKKDITLAYMHQTLAMLADHDKNADKALAEYDKAGALEPTNPTYAFHCGRIHNDKYGAAANKYEAAQKKVDAIPDADRNAADPKPDVKAALDESKAALADVNNQADAVITCWARFLGLTADKKDWDNIRPRILQAFTELYKFRHNGSTDGLDKLIDQNRANPSSSSANTASAATKS
jgi:hypothetical protein